MSADYDWQDSVPRPNPDWINAEDVKLREAHRAKQLGRKKGLARAQKKAAAETEGASIPAT